MRASKRCVAVGTAARRTLLGSIAIGTTTRGSLLRTVAVRLHLTRAGAHGTRTLGVHSGRKRTWLRSTSWTHGRADRRAAHVTWGRALTGLDRVLGQTCTRNDTLLRTVHTDTEGLGMISGLILTK